MISQIIVIGDQGLDPGFEVARQVVVLNDLQLRKVGLPQLIGSGGLLP